MSPVATVGNRWVFDGLSAYLDEQSISFDVRKLGRAKADMLREESPTKPAVAMFSGLAAIWTVVP